MPTEIKFKNPMLQRYYDSVKMLADSKSESVFDNEGVPHAVIVLSTIFDKSLRHVRIFANNMDGEIGNEEEYINSISDYLLQRGGALQVIVNSDEYLKNNVKSKAIEHIKSLPQEKIKFRVAKDSFRKKIKETFDNKGELCFFTVGDSSMYRIETDNKTHRAKCCFNDVHTSEYLINLFDTAFSSEEETVATELS